ncbi:MAG TPA: hypothetical protein PL182_12570, partial [Pseudobdellovibrionaceae bacterium]|nr:hypothetical protein [Pseudobdellovibrionaceae bacterium]
LTDQNIASLVEALVAAGLVVWIAGLWRHSAEAAYAGSSLMGIGALCALLQLKPLFFSSKNAGKEVFPHGPLGGKDPSVP